MMKSGREIYLNIFRYFHTIKNMKISQIFNDIAFKRRRKKKYIKDNKNISTLSKSLKENILSTDEKSNKIELCFYNKPVNINIDKIGWSENSLSEITEKEWLVKLNSFEWINEKQNFYFSPKQISFIILSWISDNDDEISENWAPFILSKRITAWTKWLKTNEIPSEILSVITLSIYLQLKRLFIDFEYNKPANHLIENIRAFLAGCNYLLIRKQFFDNNMESQLSNVLSEGIKQINIQILKDGAHFERGPMCHKIMFEAIKDIKDYAIYISKQKFLDNDILKKSKSLSILCENKLLAMDKWTEYLTMSDGYLPQFNDSIKTEGSKNRLSNFTKVFEDSGFFVKHFNNYSFILSCGSPSPFFLPDHSHCDILSYELSIKNEKLIIDSGCNGYENEPLRQMCRETQSHNLPMIQGQEQSDIWGIDSFGKRAKIVKIELNEKKDNLSTVIEDYLGQIINRVVNFSSNSIEISDFLKKRKVNGNFISLMHLAPGIVPEIYETEENKKTIYCKVSDNLKFTIITDSQARISDYIYFPEFCNSVGAKFIILSNKEKEAINYVIKW